MSRCLNCGRTYKVHPCNHPDFCWTGCERAHTERESARSARIAALEAENAQLREALGQATALLEQLRGALRAHEEWEARIILDDACWRDGCNDFATPRLTQDIMDALNGVQDTRTRAKAAYDVFVAQHGQPQSSAQPEAVRRVVEAARDLDKYFLGRAMSNEPSLYIPLTQLELNMWSALQNALAALDGGEQEGGNNAM